MCHTGLNLAQSHAKVLVECAMPTLLVTLYDVRVHLGHFCTGLVSEHIEGRIRAPHEQKLVHVPVEREIEDLADGDRYFVCCRVRAVQLAGPRSHLRCQSGRIFLAWTVGVHIGGMGQGRRVCLAQSGPLLEFIANT